MSYLTIYFDNKPVFLCNEITPDINQYKLRPGSIFMDGLSRGSIESLLHEIKKMDFYAGILFNEDFSTLKEAFFSHFTLIKAGGGLVKNKKGEILMIFRREKWDLPKGKLEEGESIEECAIREVQEETGLIELEIEEPIEITYHTYVQEGKPILKESHWYAMKATGSEKLIPQTEEDISEIMWANNEDIKKHILNTFPTIVKVLKHA
ncbi:MAG: NUDIX domain-containing protein [Ginsengibacter sp.]